MKTTAIKILRVASHLFNISKRAKRRRIEAFRNTRSAKEEREDQSIMGSPWGPSLIRLAVVWPISNWLSTPYAVLSAHYARITRTGYWLPFRLAYHKGSSGNNSPPRSVISDTYACTTRQISMWYNQTRKSLLPLVKSLVSANYLSVGMWMSYVLNVIENSLLDDHLL